MGKAVYKVENPVYLTDNEITEKYWDRQVLLTNIEMTAKHTMAGGIVRYYGTDSMKELWGLLGELNEAERKTIGSCSVRYIGSVGDVLLGLYAGGEGC